jgi:hypothetical protein
VVLKPDTILHNPSKTAKTASAFVDIRNVFPRNLAEVIEED